MNEDTDMPATMVSLFSGYGGLDLAVEDALGDTRVVALADIDTGPCAVLAHHWPDVPNLKDITTIDWASLGHVDVMAGGFCCQSVSTAGKRAGLKRGTRTGLWFNYAEGIRLLRPSLIVAENVGGLLTGASVCDEDERRWAERARLLEAAGLCSCKSPTVDVDGFKAPDQDTEAARTVAEAYLEFEGEGPRPADLHCAVCGGRVFEMVDGQPVRDDARLDGRLTEPTMRALGRVLADLSNLGYDAVWRGMEAADVGAPHHRLRIFMVAWPRDGGTGTTHPTLAALDGLGPMRPEGDPWAVFDKERDVWTTGQPDLFDDVDTFMGIWPKSGVMAHGAVFHLPAQWADSVRLDGLMPTPLSRDGGQGGSMAPEAKRAGNHAVTLQDVAEKGVGLLATPNCMDMLPARSGAARERALRRGGNEAMRRSTGNLREDVSLLYTPRASDGTFGRAAVSGRSLDMSGSLTTQARRFDLPGRLEDPDAE